MQTSPDIAKPPKLHPQRPAPLPPTNPTNGWNKNIDTSTSDVSEHDQSFDLPPPSMPAPPLPLNELEFDSDADKSNYAPPPPPRVDSFQDGAEDPPISPFLATLPPAPPLPSE